MDLAITTLQSLAGILLSLYIWQTSKRISLLENQVGLLIEDKQ